jgi:hypothetical protein
MRIFLHTFKDMSNNPFFQTQVSNVSAQGDTGNLDVSSYKSLLVLINVTAFSGSSVVFKVRTVDAFGTEYSLVSVTANGTGTLGAISVVEAAGSPFGDFVRVEWNPSATTFSANISVYAK